MLADPDPSRHLEINSEASRVSAQELLAACVVNRLCALRSSYEIAQYTLRQFGASGLDSAVRLVRAAGENSITDRSVRRLQENLQDGSLSLAERALSAVILNESFKRPETRLGGTVAALVELSLSGTVYDRALKALALSGACNERLVSIYSDLVILYSKKDDHDSRILCGIGVAGLFSMRSEGVTLDRRAWQALKTISENEDVSVEARDGILIKLRWQVGANDLLNFVVRAAAREGEALSNAAEAGQLPLDVELRHSLALGFAKIFLERYGLSGCEAAGALVRCAKTFPAAEKMRSTVRIGSLDVVSEDSFKWKDRFQHALMLYHDPNPERFVTLLDSRSKETQVLAAVMLWGQNGPIVTQALESFIRDDFASYEGKLLAMFVLAHNDEPRSRTLLRLIHSNAPGHSSEFARAHAKGRACGAAEEIYVNYQNLGDFWC